MIRRALLLGLLLPVALACDEKPQAPVLDSEFAFVQPLAGELLAAPTRVIVQPGDGDLSGDLLLTLDGDSLASLPGPPWALDWDLRFWADGAEHELIAELPGTPAARDTVRVTLDAAAFAFPVPRRPAQEAVLPAAAVVELAWERVPGVDALRLQFDDDADFASPLFAASVADTALTFDFDLEERWYHWRLRPELAAHAAPWGPVQRFHLGAIFATEWGGPGEDIPHAMVRRGDGVVLIAGVSGGQGSLDDGTLTAVSAEGDLLWERRYGGQGHDVLLDIAPWLDGYLLVGQTSSLGVGASSGWLLRVDTEGEVIWERSYGGPNWHGFASARTAGEYAFVAGFTTPAGRVDQDFWLLRLDAQGDVVWERNYGEEGDEFADLLRIHPGSGRFAVAGRRRPAVTPAFDDIWLMAGDADGDTLWTRSLGEPLLDDVCRDMHWEPDLRFTLAGRRGISYYETQQDALLLRCDSQGNLLWERVEGGAYRDEWRALLPLTDPDLGNVYALLGHRGDADSGGLRWQLLVDIQGNPLWEYVASAEGNGDVANLPQGLLPAGDGWLVTGSRRGGPLGLQSDAYLILTDPRGESFPDF